MSSGIEKSTPVSSIGEIVPEMIWSLLGSPQLRHVRKFGGAVSGVWIRNSLTSLILVLALEIYPTRASHVSTRFFRSAGTYINFVTIADFLLLLLDVRCKLIANM